MLEHSDLKVTFGKSTVMFCLSRTTILLSDHAEMDENEKKTKMHKNTQQLRSGRSEKTLGSCLKQAGKVAVQISGQDHI